MALTREPGSPRFPFNRHLDHVDVFTVKTEMMEGLYLPRLPGPELDALIDALPSFPSLERLNLCPAPAATLWNCIFHPIKP